MQWKNGGLSRLIQKFGKKRPTSPKKQEVEEEKKTAIHSSVPTAPTARMLMQPQLTQKQMLERMLAERSVRGGFSGGVKRNQPTGSTKPQLPADKRGTGLGERGWD